jgi:hypothetical protein
MAKETIKLKKYSDVIIEHTAHATITPGMLVSLNSDNEVLAHGTAGGNVIPVMFALEDELQGHGIADNYVAGDQVQVWVPGRGDVVNALANDEDIFAIGNFVESDGYGRLRVHVADVGDSTVGAVQNAIIGVVVEAVTAGAYGSASESSAGGTYNNPRVKIMIF